MEDFTDLSYELAGDNQLASPGTPRQRDTSRRPNQVMTRQHDESLRTNGQTPRVLAVAARASPRVTRGSGASGRGARGRGARGRSRGPVVHTAGNPLQQHEAGTPSNHTFSEPPQSPLPHSQQIGDKTDNDGEETEPEATDATGGAEREGSTHTTAAGSPIAGDLEQELYDLDGEEDETALENQSPETPAPARGYVTTTPSTFAELPSFRNRTVTGPVKKPKPLTPTADYDPNYQSFLRWQQAEQDKQLALRRVPQPVAEIERTRPSRCKELYGRLSELTEMHRRALLRLCHEQPHSRVVDNEFTRKLKRYLDTLGKEIALLQSMADIQASARATLKKLAEEAAPPQPPSALSSSGVKLPSVSVKPLNLDKVHSPLEIYQYVRGVRTACEAGQVSVPGAVDRIIAAAQAGTQSMLVQHKDLGRFANVSSWEDLYKVLTNLKYPAEVDLMLAHQRSFNTFQRKEGENIQSLNSRFVEMLQLTGADPKSYTTISRYLSVLPRPVSKAVRAKMGKYSLSTIRFENVLEYAIQSSVGWDPNTPVDEDYRELELPLVNEDDNPQSKNKRKRGGKQPVPTPKQGDAEGGRASAQASAEHPSKRQRCRKCHTWHAKGEECREGTEKKFQSLQARVDNATPTGKGPVCFRCKVQGHRAAECPAALPSSSADPVPLPKPQQPPASGDKGKGKSYAQPTAKAMSILEQEEEAPALEGSGTDFMSSFDQVIESQEFGLSDNEDLADQTQAAVTEVLPEESN
jgi:hypothetical protein